MFDQERRSLGEIDIGESALGEITADFFVGHLEQCAGILVRNSSPTQSSCELRSIRVFAINQPSAAHIKPMPSPAPADPSFDLHDISTRPFTPHAKRAMGKFFSLTTTEVCNLSCVYCHFNGPTAIKKARTLPPELVCKLLDEMPDGAWVTFAGTGEYFLDPYALDHLRYAIARGLTVDVLSHGQFFTPELMDELLRIGVRYFRMSCDSVDAAEYAKIRRGGELQKIVDAAAYFRSRKADYPDIDVMICATLLSTTMSKRQGMIDFWTGKVDQISFHAEYFDTFKFRNATLTYNPTERVDCSIELKIVPSGKIAPCCAIMVYEHDGDTSWLPDVRTHTMQQAYDILCDLYDDSNSPLAKLCAKCDWWIQFHENFSTGQRRSPFHEVFKLPNG
jgi:pyruvate-formate lyase-activating enzyme